MEGRSSPTKKTIEGFFFTLIGLILTTGVSIFLGFSLHKAQVKRAYLSAKIDRLETKIDQLEMKLNLSNPTKITQTIVDQDEQLSWETLYQDKELLLTIKGRNESELQLDKICVLSVTKIENEDNENEFYLSGDERVNKNDCQKSSLFIPETDGTWKLKHIFSDQTSRTIRVEKIYKNITNTKNYIDFTIGKSNE